MYEKVRFLEHRSKTSCLAFHAGKDEVEMISVVRKEGSNLDLSTPESIHTAFVEHPEELKWFSTRRPYTEEREKEIHQLFEQGCVLSTEIFWTALKSITVNE